MQCTQAGASKGMGIWMARSIIGLMAGLLLWSTPSFAQDSVIIPLTERPSDDEQTAMDEPLAAPIPDANGVQRVAVLRALDKITARVIDMDAPIGIPVRFESLEITVQYCHRRPPEETPETTAFLQVVDHRLEVEGEDLEPIFSGWMFASSPALNALDHPTYDVWLIDCRTL